MRIGFKKKKRELADPFSERAKTAGRSHGETDRKDGGGGCARLGCLPPSRRRNQGEPGSWRLGATAPLEASAVAIAGGAGWAGRRGTRTRAERQVGRSRNGGGPEAHR